MTGTSAPAGTSRWILLNKAMKPWLERISEMTVHRDSDSLGRAVPANGAFPRLAFLVAQFDTRTRSSSSGQSIPP